jgi:hypothetical protein
VLASLCAALWLPATAGAQQRQEEALGRAETPIFNDNLDAARRRAVRNAQANVIRNTLERLLDAEWLVLFDAELRERILDRIDRYINAYRVQRQQTSLDRTRYFAEVVAQVDVGQLRQDLREMGLPVVGDPPQAVDLVYDSGDEVLGRTGGRDAVRTLLGERLAKLNLRLAGSKGIPTPQLAQLDPAAPQEAQRERLLRGFRSRMVLALRFSRAAPAGGAPGGTLLNAWFYQSDTGTLLGSFAARANVLLGGSLTEAGLLDIENKLMRPLLTQLQPGALRDFEEPAAARRLRIRVLGFQSYLEEEAFERAFFSGTSNFKGFLLYGFDRDTVTYEGEYTGNRARLVDSLQGNTVGDFKIREVFWYDDTLELDVERIAFPEHLELRPFPPAERRPLQTRVIEAFFADHLPDTLQDPTFEETEDNGWFDRANILDFQTTIYGFVDSRSDLDFYLGDFLQPGEELEIHWQQLERTNLSPAIRIFDAQRNLLHMALPKGSTVFKVRLPKGEQRFFLEIGDRFGYVPGDAGGYLNYHYLLAVRRLSEAGQMAGAVTPRR